MPLSVFDVCPDNMIYFAWISLFLGGEFSCVIAELFWFNAERLRKSTQISDFTSWFVNLLPKAVDGVHIVFFSPVFQHEASGMKKCHNVIVGKVIN